MDLGFVSQIHSEVNIHMLKEVFKIMSPHRLKKDAIIKQW